ncbi:hypothetical protein Tco_0559437 [Tanacetum coccineum]
MLSMSSQTIPGSVRSLDPLISIETYGKVFLLALDSERVCRTISEPRPFVHGSLILNLKGISNLCLDPPILWSSSKSLSFNRGNPYSSFLIRLSFSSEEFVSVRRSLSLQFDIFFNWHPCSVGGVPGSHNDQTKHHEQHHKNKKNQKI